VIAVEEQRRDGEAHGLNVEPALSIVKPLSSG
jgi:hypothetical protein